MRHPSTVVRLLAALVVVLGLGASSAPPSAAPKPSDRLDPLLRQRSLLATGRSRIIVRTVANAPPGITRTLLQQLGGTPGRALPIINGQAGSVPNAALAALAASRFVEHVALDRPVVGTMERTSAAVGAAAVRHALGYDGTGVGVAIIDSGVTAWHDDLTGAPEVAQRVDRFVDLVNGRETSYDDYGHGTHVAGIVAGNGFDADGARTGIAPGARLTVIKVLDASGGGRISDVIAALDYIVSRKGELKIRVANLSIAADAYESYESDPLTLAAQRAVSEGIVIVAAAGNAGHTVDGRVQYSSITAPGNAPWVLTVGASSHMGTVDRSDDSIAGFSSRGPGLGGNSAKPDLVAPGVGIESLSDPNSALYTARSTFLLSGTVATSYLPYLSLSGTSMSAPIVSGTVALMLQANPALTPNQVKAILQYTAEAHAAYDVLTQGAGFLNAKGAVELAHHFANASNVPFPAATGWSMRIIWGNRLVQGGRMVAAANAWSTSTTWGAATTPDGGSIEWGVICSVGDCDTDPGLWTPWRMTAFDENVVWGLLCGGDDCQAPWSAESVFGISDSQTVVWGMDGDDTVVWGMNCTDASCTPMIWSSR